MSLRGSQDNPALPSTCCSAWHEKGKGEWENGASMRGLWETPLPAGEQVIPDWAVPGRLVLGHKGQALCQHFALAATAEHKTSLRAGAQQRGSWGSTGAGNIYCCIPKHIPMRSPVPTGWIYTLLQCPTTKYSGSPTAPKRGSDPTLIPWGFQQSSTVLEDPWYVPISQFLPSYPGGHQHT